ncbi:MAG: type IV pilin protein [Gammaproteobacteria bacterium]|jgi:type IV pilus assembly protein PilE
MKSKQGGFTLVELMITVVVISLLAMIAIPAYNDSVQKARRSDAKSTLTSAASRQEQYFLDNKTYTANLTDLGYAASPADSIDGHYTVKVAAATASCPIATCFKLIAVPNDEDEDCQSFTLDSTGSKNIEGSPAPTQTAEQCW